MSLTALQGGRGLAVWGFKVALPGTTFRYGNAPYSSISEGHFDGVGNFSSITRAVSNRDGRLPAVQFTAKVWDHARTLQRVLTGARAKEVRGSAASLKLLTPTVTYSSAPTFFDGQVIRWGISEPFRVEFTCKTNDEQLARPSRQQSITANTWPLAAPEAYNLVAPVLYGYHDASTTRATGPGFVRTILVDRSVFRYMVCQGRAKSILRVYVNGTQISSSLYTTSYLTTKGHTYTTILFDNATDAYTAGVATVGGVSIPTAVVTCDAEGYESVGDGSGSLITNPTSQLAHFLSQWILGAYSSGNWLSTNALIDSTLLTAEAAVMTALTAGGSFYKSSRITGLDAIAAYCVSFERKCFWSRNFKIGLDGEKVFTQPYLGNVIKWGTMEMKPTSITEKDFSVTSQITARQCYDNSEETYIQTIDIQDATATIEAVREIERPWSEAR